MTDLKVVVDRKDISTQVQKAERGEKGDKGEPGQRGPSGADVSKIKSMLEAQVKNKDSMNIPPPSNIIESPDGALYLDVYHNVHLSATSTHTHTQTHTHTHTHKHTCIVWVY